MMHEPAGLNAFAQRAWREIIEAHPDWADLSTVLAGGDFEIAVPTPSSRASHLVLFSAGAEHLWLRFAPPRACYPVDDVAELLTIARRIMADELSFVVVTKRGEWQGTTLAAPQAIPKGKANELLEVTSWSGKHDRILVVGRRRRTKS
jgi:hypothetical protein